jgi:hypothetical protein
MKGRALTYAEIRESAQRAAREIDEKWPEWKKALSEPPQPAVPVQAATKADPRKTQ